MRKLIILTLILLSILNASAQEESKLVFFLSPGMSIINSPGNLGDLWRPGFGVSLGLEYPLGKNLSLRGSLSFDISQPAHDTFLKSYFESKNVRNIDQLDLGRWNLTDGKASFWGGTLNVKFEIPISAKLFPYVIGGGGVVFFNVQSIRISGPGLGIGQTSFIDPKGYPAIDFGLGLEIKIAEKAKLFMEGTRLQAFADIETNSPFLATNENVIYYMIRGGISVR